jgi:hypothetical protein
MIIEGIEEELHPIGSAIPKALCEKFNIAVKIDGRSKRRILAEIIENYCNKILPENYEQVKNLLDKKT